MHKVLAFSSLNRYFVRQQPTIEGRGMKLVLAAGFVLGFVSLSASAANAIDLAELAPCRPAAARFCDREGGMSWNNLMRCGATLAAHSWRVGDECRAVLRKYGQL
ncbi:MAG: hypothetical protein WAM75_09715 [Xanthobacteraceae bacterium]